MSQKKKKDKYREWLYFILGLVVILLSFFNMYLIHSNNDKVDNQIKVLGAESDLIYWEQMTKDHPTYIDAWLEMGNKEKILEIDPNYFK